MKTKEKATSILMNMKINPNMSGFDYLRKAIELCYKDGSLLINTSTKLYPILSNYFKTKPSIIERCIRFAISNAYNNGGLLYINQFYNTIVYKNNFKYSNSELIAIIVEKIRLDNNLEEKNKKLSNSKK